MPHEPVVLIHGYSDRGEAFSVWKQALIDNGYQAEEIAVSTARLIANPVADRLKARAIDELLERLRER